MNIWILVPPPRLNHAQTEDNILEVSPSCSYSFTQMRLAEIPLGADHTTETFRPPEDETFNGPHEKFMHLHPARDYASDHCLAP